VLGFDLASEAGKIRERVGYMSQRFSLYADLSVFENLRFRAQVYGSNRPRAAAETAIDDFELTEFARYPAGRLSGGLGASASTGCGPDPFAQIDSPR
jgi:ABC-2 type transport system ATP-binding protein